MLNKGDTVSSCFHTPSPFQTHTNYRCILYKDQKTRQSSLWSRNGKEIHGGGWGRGTSGPALGNEQRQPGFAIRGKKLQAPLWKLLLNSWNLGQQHQRAHWGRNRQDNLAADWGRREEKAGNGGEKGNSPFKVSPWAQLKGCSVKTAHVWIEQGRCPDQSGFLTEF